MKNKKCKVSVFNTITEQYEWVEVAPEIREVYLHENGVTKANDEKFYRNELQFSSLIGGEEGSFENFKEFINNKNTPENEVLYQEMKELAYIALDSLPTKMKEYFLLRYYEGYSIKEIAQIKGVSPETVKESIAKARKKLDEFLKIYKKI